MKKLNLLLLPLLAFAMSGCGADAEGDEPAGMAGAPAGTAGTAGATATGITTYSLLIGPYNWFAPPDIGSEIGAFVPEFLFTVDDTGATGVFATGDGSHVQDACNPTSAMPPPAAGVIGPFDPPMYIRHNTENVQVNTVVRSLTMTNVLPVNGVPSTTGEVKAVMDFRQLAPMFTVLSSPTPDDLCLQLEGGFGAPCEPCPHDQAVYCLTIEADGVGATPVATGLTPIATQPASCPLNPAP